MDNDPKQRIEILTKFWVVFTDYLKLREHIHIWYEKLDIPYSATILVN
jgi:hypothetical protein